MEIKRDYYLNKLIEAKGDGLIKIITGIRRCGKSYLMNKLFYNYLIESGVKEDHILKIALDDIDNVDLLVSKNLSTYIKNKMVDSDTYYVLLDEVQLVNRFEFVLNGLLYLDNIDIYVTGSNSRFLSTDIITEFRGRGEEIRIYPLSFLEFMSVYDGSTSDGWKDYCVYGGLPTVVGMKSDEQKTKYLKDQVNNIYINDVIERNRIKNDIELKQLIQIISSSIGSLSNPNKLSNTFKSEEKINIEPRTIDTYLKYLEEAFIIEKSNRYNVKGKKYMNTPYKFYFTDIGIRNSLINFRQTDEETHIMENIIYLELRRRGYDVDVGVIEYKTSKDNKEIYKQLEVDFIANKGNNKYYIQSVFSMPTEEKIEQELRPLLNINDSFKKFIIVKEDVKRTRTDDGIIRMSVFDFLLDINSLDY